MPYKLNVLTGQFDLVGSGGGGGDVTSVNGQTGDVVLDKTDIGLDQVDNTSDLDKPISNDTQAALDTKAPSVDFTANYVPFGDGDDSLNQSAAFQFDVGGKRLYIGSEGPNTSGVLTLGSSGGSGLIQVFEDLTLQSQNGKDVKINTDATLAATFSGTDQSLTVVGDISGANLSGTNTGDQTITLEGDATGSGTGTITVELADLGSNGTFGSATGVSVVTVDNKGRITSANTTTIDIPHTQINDFETAVENIIGASAGDIKETLFSFANNESTPVDITDFLFVDSVVRSFTALVSVEIDADSDLYEQFILNGINKNGSFNMSQESVGDTSGIVFSITNAGQIQYTSLDYTGFVSGEIKFRAITTSI